MLRGEISTRGRDGTGWAQALSSPCARRLTARVLTRRSLFCTSVLSMRLSVRTLIDVLKRPPQPLPRRLFFHAARLPGKRTLPAKTTSGANDQGLHQSSQVRRRAAGKLLGSHPLSPACVLSFLWSFLFAISHFGTEAVRSTDDEDRRRFYVRTPLLLL